MNKKKVNGIRHVVELRENVMMNENKTDMKFLSTGEIYDRHIKKKEKFFKFSCSIFRSALFKDVIIS